MNKIWAFRYTLEAITEKLSHIAGPGLRRGALLKVETRHEVGYCDLHPWTELGDLDLELQLSKLANGESTPLLQRSLALASADAQLRSLGISAFGKSLAPIKNHYLITNITSLSGKDTQLHIENIVAGGYPAIKVKIDPKVFDAAFAKAFEIAQQVGLLLRLDFNCSGEYEALSKTLVGLSTAERESIDYIEDPMPWNAAAWTQLEDQSGVSMALDGALPRELVPSVLSRLSNLVMKPAAQDVLAIIPKLTLSPSIGVTLTSYLDHPLGQASALWVAQEFQRLGGRLKTCGLASCSSYQPNEFSQRLTLRGGEIHMPPDLGFGFTDLLQKLPWKPLC